MRDAPGPYLDDVSSESNRGCAGSWLGDAGRPLFQNRDRRQLLALEKFEEGAAARGDVWDGGFDAVLLDGRERGAGAGDRERGAAGDRLCEDARALAELVEFEHPNRPVPHDRASVRAQAREALRRIRTDI